MDNENSATKHYCQPDYKKSACNGQPTPEVSQAALATAAKLLGLSCPVNNDKRKQ